MDRYIPKRQCPQSPVFSPTKLHAIDEQETPIDRLINTGSKRRLIFSQSKSTEKTQTLTKFIVESCSNFQNQSTVKYSKTVEAYKIMDAPDVLNDFYSNTLDYSHQETVGVAVKSLLFFYKQDRNIVPVCRFNHSFIYSIKFSQCGDGLFAGEETGRLEFYDVQANVMTREIKSHYDRIACCTTVDSHTIVTGSKDHTINIYDMRLKRAVVCTLEKHKREVCGLSFQNNLLASGGNDNRVCIWDLRERRLLKDFRKHESAIKGLNWCPWRHGLLAAGGGRNDPKICFYNHNSDSMEECVKVKNQITSLQWREANGDLLTTHGCSEGEAYGFLWNYQTKQIRQRLKGHFDRILVGALNPIDQSIYCTLGADETIRFWKLASQKQKQPVSKRCMSVPIR